MAITSAEGVPPAFAHCFVDPTRWANGARTYWGYDQLPAEVRTDVVHTFREVFSAPPWNESWSERRVLRKLFHELAVPAVPECAGDTAFLSVIDGDCSSPIGGFSWGAVVDADAVPGRVLSAHPVPCSQLDQLRRALEELGAERVVFTDEIAILPQFRGGILPVAQLCYPTTVVGSHYGLPGLCWSSARSRIVPILEYYHYRVIARVGDILFLYSPAEGVAATKHALDEIFAAAGYCEGTSTSDVDRLDQSPGTGGLPRDTTSADTSVWLTARVYHGFDALCSRVLDSVAHAYASVFREPPWKENWTTEAIVRKLIREITAPGSYLTVLFDGDRAAGFCWGAVIDRTALPARVQAARPVGDTAELVRLLAPVDERVVFVDEIAVLPQYRDRGAGLADILYLVWPVVLAIAHHHIGALCWSTRNSRIVPILTERFQFTALGSAGEISFYHLPVDRGARLAHKLIADFGRTIQLVDESA